MSNSQDALLDKIRKLNAKANDPSVTEAEAMLYAAKVSELLSAHNLSESSLDTDDEDCVISEGSFSNSLTHALWARWIATSVSRLYFCKTYTHKVGQKVTIMFVGRAHNVEVARSMADYLIKTVKRLGTEYANSEVAKKDWDYNFSTCRSGFYNGAGNRLYYRLKEMTDAQTKHAPVRSSSGTPSNLPALYEDEHKAIDKFMSALGLEKSKSSNTKVNNRHTSAGRAAADNISLNSQVGGTSTRMIK